MDLVELDLARAKITEAHRQAERSRQRRRLVIEQREARQARRGLSRRRTPSRWLRFIPPAGSTRQ